MKCKHSDCFTCPYPDCIADDTRSVPMDNPSHYAVPFCKNCGRPFANRKTKSHFCSDSCQEEYRIKMHTVRCELCGTSFLRVGNAVYCPACQEEIKRKREIRMCEECGSEFRKTEKGRQRYCSDACRESAESKKKRPMTKVCKTCGKEFDAKGAEKSCPDCRERVSKPLVLEEKPAPETVPVPEKDNREIPAHYDMTPEPIDVIIAWRLDFLLGNVVKYIARAGRKGSKLEDLKKAKAYIERAIKEELK